MIDSRILSPSKSHQVHHLEASHEQRETNNNDFIDLANDIVIDITNDVIDLTDDDVIDLTNDIIDLTDDAMSLIWTNMSLIEPTTMSMISLIMMR